MHRFVDLTIGFTDAENYRRRENRELLNRLFVRTEKLDRLCTPAISFLMGEKGTGKTAYAVYLSNNNYDNTLSSLRYIRETDYLKFIALKREKHLQLSDYASIWKVILLLLLSQQLCDKEKGLAGRFRRLGAAKAAIDEYYNGAFAPEIVQALQFVEQSSASAKLMAKHANASGEASETASFSESRFQTNLLFLRKTFEDAIAQAKPANNHILFIDGIDIRPESVPYAEYRECIKGLANAAWELNNDFFPTIKGGAGRSRVVMLVRPDIFQSLGLQNQNTKARDNTVFLDWRTEYANHRRSDLFRAVDHLLASQQAEELSLGNAWDHYFPWNATNVYEIFDTPTSFLAFLRWSYYRPRDLATMLMMLQDIAREAGYEGTSISYTEFEDPKFKKRYSDYLLGEIKDHLSFYYGPADYELFLKFFTYLHGRHRFDFAFFRNAYQSFRKELPEGTIVPQFMVTDGAFLQFLYDLNVICYFERPESDNTYVRWCFRERSYSNVSPKVKTGLEYQIFYGLYKALNVGQELK